MLFPELQNKSFGRIDLDTESKRWVMEKDLARKNPLLDPSVCEKFVQECHQRLGVDFSYGGWMENRSTLWRGSYLDDDEKYLHLGMDFNVPAGTAVAMTRSGTVLRIDDDYPEPYGWGNRIIVHDELTNCVFVFAHLHHDEILHVAKASRKEKFLQRSEVHQKMVAGSHIFMCR